MCFDPDELVAFFTTKKRPKRFVGMPICEGIPEDAEVVSVQAEWNTGKIKIMVYHRSFQELSGGQFPECVNAIIGE